MAQDKQSLREDATWETELELRKGSSRFLHPYAQSQCTAHNQHIIGPSARLTQAAPEAVDAGWASDPQLPGSQAQSISCVQVVVLGDICSGARRTVQGPPE